MMRMMDIHHCCFSLEETYDAQSLDTLCHNLGLLGYSLSVHQDRSARNRSDCGGVCQGGDRRCRSATCRRLSRHVASFTRPLAQYHSALVYTNHDTISLDQLW